MLVVSVALCAGETEKMHQKRGIFQEAALPVQQFVAQAPVAFAQPQEQFLATQYPSAYQTGEFAQFQPEAFAAAPVQPAYALQTAPAQVQTIVKKLHVPYERQIPIDNPIYTHVERPIAVDNPVPYLKVIEQPVPVHVDTPITVPVIKEVQVPQPYVHKVRLVLQKVFIQQQQAAPQKTIIIADNHQQNNGWNGWD